MKQPQSTTSIELPLGNGLKYDPRSIIPVNQCKAVAVLQTFDGLNSAEKAAREVEELHKRNKEKLKNHEEFLKKTKERVKSKQIIKDYQEDKEILKKMQFNSFTFLNNEPSGVPSGQYEEKTAEFIKDTVEKVQSGQKVSKSKSLKQKNSKVTKKTEEVVEIKEKQTPKTSTESAIPRFINVANMKISYNPKMLNPKSPKQKPNLNQATSSPNYSTTQLSSVRSAKSKKSQEQMRYSIALKNLVSSQLSHPNPLKSPSVCTCVTFSKSESFNPKHCANNCPFYKKQGEYQRALKEMLASFKASE